MYPLLAGLRVVEAASFIAGPSCGLYLQQFGAEVIRIDPIGGGPDFHRWPRAANGASFYWEGLNKGKKSIAIDLARPEGRELALRLATAPGEDRGLFLTNYPPGGWFSYEQLAARRADIICLRIMGWGDGRSGVDYTVNCAVGIPAMTGHADSDEPVNHVLPAWDLLAGAYASAALLAAERRRRTTGEGTDIRVPLGELALTTLGNIGQLAEVATSGTDRPRIGNDLYGALGRDFLTRDHRRLMLVAITPRQWTNLTAALHITAPIQALEAELGLSFASDEGLRFEHRARLFSIIECAVAGRDYSELGTCLDHHGVCWGPYRTISEALACDARFDDPGGLFRIIDQPSGQRYPSPGSAAILPRRARLAPAPAPRLGEHSDDVLAEVLGLPASEIGSLHDRGVIAGPS